MHYLLIEREVNSENFTEADKPAAVKQLQQLLNNAALLDQRFIDLNKDTYYLSELKEENSVRNKKIQILYNKLSGAH